jgi:GDPmannose 4,6-dehydratase
MKAALVTGVTGQDGSYLAEFLLEKDYDVFGMTRFCSEKKHSRIEHIKENPKFHVIEGDLTDTSRINKIINSFEKYDAVEVYNLGAISFVKISFDQPEYTANVDALGTLRILEAIRQCNFSSKFRFYQASTSEMYGKIVEPIQNETTPFYPRSPYGVAKLFAFWMTKNYRESFGLYACSGILFNHESERRGPEFVTRKITLGLAEYMRSGTPIELGNIDAQRDWGHAEDYVEMMWRMLQQPTPDDFVIATGETHSVRDFIEEACKILDIPIEWREDHYVDLKTSKPIVVINPIFYRPAEVDVLIGDASKALSVMGWKPKTTFKDLVKRMVMFDCKTA